MLNTWTLESNTHSQTGLSLGMSAASLLMICTAYYVYPAHDLPYICIVILSLVILMIAIIVESINPKRTIIIDVYNKRLFIHDQYRVLSKYQVIEFRDIQKCTLSHPKYHINGTFYDIQIKHKQSEVFQLFSGLHFEGTCNKSVVLHYISRLQNDIFNEY